MESPPTRSVVRAPGRFGNRSVPAFALLEDRDPHLEELWHPGAYASKRGIRARDNVFDDIHTLDILVGQVQRSYDDPVLCGLLDGVPEVDTRDSGALTSPTVVLNCSHPPDRSENGPEVSERVQQRTTVNLEVAGGMSHLSCCLGV